MDQSGNQRKHDVGPSGIPFILAIALGLFHVGTAYFGVLPAVYQRAVHWGLMSNLIFILRLLDKERRNPLIIACNVIGMVLTTAATVYIVMNYEVIMGRLGDPTVADIYMGVALLIAVLIAGFQVLGWPLPLLSVLFLAYAFVGPYMPGVIKHPGYSLERIATFLYLGTEGIFGAAMNVAATYIFLFVLLGGFLELSGAGKFFVDIAFSISGRIPGGPAQAAVVSSALMGTISGSGVANVATTGTFTIPLMKKTGYKPEFAAAVEAVASNGGQIMPPVMGAVAFLMAEIVGIPYIQVARAALIPSILYFCAIMIVIYLEARKLDIKPMAGEEIPPISRVLKEGFYYLLPLIVLVYVLIRGDSPMKAGIYAFFCTIAISFVKKETRIDLKRIAKGFWNTAMTARPISAACACAGIVIGITSLTGLGVKMSRLIVKFSGGKLCIALPLTMIVSLIMGMGLPTTAAYLVLAVLGAPALIRMGADVLPAHLFILYFGALSTITPPVALSTYAAAGIAGSDPIRTGVTAVKLAAVAFIIPYMFVYGPELLLIGNAMEILWAVITALLGCVGLAAALSGWFMDNLSYLARIAFFLSSLTLLKPGFYTDLVGMGLLVFAALITKWHNHSKLTEATTNSK